MKILKWLGIIVGSLIALAVVAGLIAHKKMPEGKAGPEAEALAEKMMASINCAAWDTVGAVSWTFAGANEHLWDKKSHRARVKWGDGMEALVDINTRTGLAYKGGVALSGEEAESAIDAAWKYWVNDAYWLNAPCKVKDGGTSRSLVEMEDGSQALKVTYGTGGATPGDTYLWKMDEAGVPISVNMWVSIMPIGGIQFSWEGWEEHQGAKIASTHEGVFTLRLENIQTGNTAAELNGGTNPFADLD